MVEKSLQVLFFFSSRRRHTRCSRDWSSDVCSSDLYRRVRAARLPHAARSAGARRRRAHGVPRQGQVPLQERDRKSTRLNSSHGYISYAVFCLKKKKDEE